MLNRNLIILGIICISLPALLSCTQKKEEGDAAVSEDFEYLYHDALTGETPDKDNKGSIQKEYRVERGEFRKSISEIGEIVYEDLYYADIESDEAENINFLVNEGDRVKKGDILATYDSVYNEVDIVERTRDVERMENEYQAEYDAKKAEINMAEYELKKLTDSSERKIKELQIKKLKITLDKFTQTKDAIVRAREELNETVRRNSLTSVAAAHDGYVISVIKKDDNSYFRGDSVVVISPKKRYHITVPSRENINGMKYGSDVTVIVEGMNGGEDVTMKGRVVSAANILGPSHSFESTYVDIIDEPEGVNWNNPIKVRYDGIYIKDALKVPADAVMAENEDAGAHMEENEYVYIKNNDTIYKSYISVIDENNEYYRVSGGVAEGDVLVCYK